MITSSDLIGKFRYALDNKWGYIWGTAGVKWTAARQADLEKTTDADRAQGRKYGSKWIGHYVADCSGMFSWAFKQLGSTMYHGSNTMYMKWCKHKGELKSGKRTDGATLKPGTAVFVWNGNTYSHVGLYVGDGNVIEAANTQKGVIQSKVTASKWTHWGELKDVSFDGSAPEPQPDPEPAGKRPTLRRGDKGPYVVELQTDLVRLGYGIGPCGIDGDYGSATQAAVRQFQYDKRIGIDGVCGPETWATIDKALAELKDPEPVVITYTVMIRDLGLDAAKKIAAEYPDAEIVEGSAAK